MKARQHAHYDPQQSQIQTLPLQGLLKAESSNRHVIPASKHTTQAGESAHAGRMLAVWVWHQGDT